MRKIVSLLATAGLVAGLSLSTAAPASAAGPFCFGLPDEPLAYVCVTVNEPSAPDPQVTWGEPSYVADVPAVCYGVGCTEEGPLYVSLPWVSGLGVPTLVEVYWAGADRIDVKQIIADVRDLAENPERLCSMIHPSLACFSITS